jgi:hypothetical protein
MKNDIVKDALNSLLKAKYSLESQLKSVNHAIKSLNGDEEIKDISVLDDSANETTKGIDLEYNKKWSNVDKFLYLLRKKQRFLHFREAAELIVELEGEGKANDLASKLSSATNQLKKSKQLVKIQPTKRNRETFWGIPKWLDEKGKAKPEHDINEKYLLSSSSRSRIELDI